MPNIRLVLEYDGTLFHGWQKQQGLRTVQTALHETLELVLREKIAELRGASRTDVGVHARGQVVNFLVEREPDLTSLKHSVSSLLKGEVAVLDAEIVPDDFNARYGAKCKQYTYAILNRRQPPVLDKNRVWHVSADLDLERMRAAARELVGEHDFRSFQAADCSAQSSVREILESELTGVPPCLCYRVVGTGFLKQMVRTIVGTLVDLGRGKSVCPSMEAILAARDRSKAGMTAPACGLCLDWVKY
jgi:tRNA pseudouridine38-40 synthase